MGGGLFYVYLTRIPTTVDVSTSMCYSTLNTHDGGMVVVGSKEAFVLYMRMDMVDIIPLVIPPKSDLHRHKRIEYTLTFVPDTRQWEWEFRTVTIVRYVGTEVSYVDAMRSAKEHIDLAVGDPYSE